MTYRLLFVEDDSSFKKLLEMRLRSFLKEIEVVHCASIDVARKTLSEQSASSFDLVLLDQNLPDGKGIVLLEEGLLEGASVLAMSSDDDPEMPGANIRLGAAFFISKARVSEPLFKPLVLGIIDRGKLERELADAKVKLAVIDTVKTLISTLRHEINNPLGAVIGAAYLLKHVPNSTPKEQELVQLVETSSARIKHVMEQLSEAMEVKPVLKAQHKVFHVPGDKPWDE